MVSELRSLAAGAPEPVVEPVRVRVFSAHHELLEREKMPRRMLRSIRSL
jgi:hypothetical protein